MKKELIVAYIFGFSAIVLGIIIILFGKVGGVTGNTLYKFDGFERFFGLYPIGVGSFIIWAFRFKYHSKKKKNEK